MRRFAMKLSKVKSLIWRIGLKLIPGRLTRELRWRAGNPLENLSIDIRRRILQVSELEGLKALLHASPIYYRQYRRERYLILPDSLQETLGIIHFADAYAVYQSSSDTFLNKRTPETVTRFLRNYGVYRLLRDEAPTIKDFLTEDEVMSMVKFYFAVVLPLSYNYVDWALDNLSHQTRAVCGRALTRTEELRLLRALYRFQLCCNLFGVGLHALPGHSFEVFNASEFLEMFLCLFHPWEVEELCCIYAYAEDHFRVVLLRIAWDLSPDNPKFKGPPEVAVDLTDACELLVTLHLIC
ncbi:hypothetical protein BDV12DRAFT_142803 [Aspergillus spectabilis]